MAFESKTGGWKTWNSTLFPKNEPHNVKAELTWKILRDHGTITLKDSDCTYNVTHTSGSHIWTLEPSNFTQSTPLISAKQLGNMGRAMVVTEGETEYEFLPISKARYDFVIRKMEFAAIEKDAEARDGEVGVDGIVAILRSTGSFSISFDDSLSWQLRSFLNWMSIMWLRRMHRQSQY